MSQSAQQALFDQLAQRLEAQSSHPIYPPLQILRVRLDSLDADVRIDQVLMTLPLETIEKMRAQREAKILREKEDPFNHRYQPAAWRRIDLMVARKRLELPGALIELFVLGGHDSAKTDGGVIRVARQHFFTEDASTWLLHSTQTSSQTIHQERMKQFLPLEVREKFSDKGSARKTMTTKIGTTPGKGFTGDAFYVKWPVKFPHAAAEVTCGGLCEAKFFASNVDNLQGSKLTGASSDELVHEKLAETVKQRMIPRAKDTANSAFLSLIQKCVEILERGDPLPPYLQGHLYRGVHIMGFTPMQGYSPLVASALDGAETIEEDTTHIIRDWMRPGMCGMTAEFMAQYQGKEFIRGEKVPRFKQPTEKARLVAYLYTYDNPWTNYPGKVMDCDGKDNDYIRVTVFGDVRKEWNTQFHAFDLKQHRRDWSVVPSTGCVGETIDPAGAKPWVIVHTICDPAGRVIVAQEWPCESIPIEGHGSPGLWAVSSKEGKRNGDEGPAQKLRLKWGRARYIRLIWELRQRLAAKLIERNGGTKKGLGYDIQTLTLEWPDKPEWKLEGDFVIPEWCLIDPRFSGQPTESNGEVVSLQMALPEEANGIWYDQAPGDRHENGDEAINAALAADKLGMPGLMVLKECTNTLWMFSNYALPENRVSTMAKDEACKDFRDPCAYFLLSGAEYTQPGRALTSEGGCRD